MVCGLGPGLRGPYTRPGPGTLYKAAVQYTTLEEPSARPWVGRTDAEQEREELGV